MRIAALLAVLALAVTSLSPRAVRADLPPPPDVTLPARVLIVGTNGGVPDVLGRFQVTVRDLEGAPIAGAIVVASIPETRGIDYCSSQPNVFMQCDTGSGDATGAVTDANGVATLTILGRGDHLEPAPSVAPSLRIYVDGIRMGTVPVAVLDHDGGGLGPSDVSLWLDDYFTTLSLERSDLNGDGILGPADLSFLLVAFFANGSLQGCAAACP